MGDLVGAILQVVGDVVAFFFPERWYQRHERLVWTILLMGLVVLFVIAVWRIGFTAMSR